MVKSPSRPKRGAAPAALDDDDDLAFDLATPSGRGGDLDEDLVAPPRGGRSRRAAFDDDDDDFAPGRAGVSSNLVLAGLAGTLAAGLVGAWFMVAADPSAAPDPEAPPTGMTGLTQALPPMGGGLARAGADLMSPPNVEATDRSMARRPWLAETPGDAAPAASPAAPGQAAPPPGPVTADPAAAPAAPAPEPTLSPAAASAAAVAQGAKPRPAGQLLPLETPGPRVQVSALPVEEGFRPGRMPTFADLPAPGSFGTKPLPDAPLSDLLKASDHGLLPVIAQDGRVPWRTYARPFTGNASAPRIALIVTGLGMRTSATQAAIAQMPPDVTLAFSPYASNLPMWMGRARQMGHETLLEVPTEPVGFPTMDPGALGLITAVSELENRKRLESALASAGGYVGVLATHAGRYTDTPTALRPLLESLKARGLLYVHRGAPKAVNANADVAPPVNIATTVLDNPAFQRAIDERLAGLEDTARAQGFAIGTLSASPLALYRATRWLAGLDARGFALAPVSALVLTPDNGASR